MKEKYIEKILDAHRKETSFASTHLNSYNEVIQDGIKNIIDGLMPIVVTVENKSTELYTAEFDIQDIYVDSPNIISSKTGERRLTFPQECRILNTSYSLNLYCQYKFKITTSDGQVTKTPVYIESEEPILLGKIPCMVGSRFCNLYNLSTETLRSIGEDEHELGGYFVIGGTEFNIVPQEIKTENMIFKNYNDKTDTYTVWIQSKKGGAYIYAYYTIITLNSNNEIFITVSISKASKVKIPIMVFLKSLGILTDKTAFEMMFGKSTEQSEIQRNALDILHNTFLYDIGQDINTQQEALVYVGNKMKKHSVYHRNLKEEQDESVISNIGRKLLDTELLPHIGEIKDLYKKSIFLTDMVRTVINLKLGIEKPQDQNDYGNKRIQRPGELWGQLFRYTFMPIKKMFRTGIKTELSKFSITKDYNKIISRIIATGKLQNMETQVQNYIAKFIKLINSKSCIKNK